jgi:hypothetical protein
MRAILLASATATSLKGLRLHKLLRPHPQRVRVRFAVIQHGMRAHDEQLAQIPITHFRDAPQPLLAAGRVLPGHQPKEGGELARSREARCVLHACHHGRGRDRTKAENRYQPACCLVLMRHLRDGAVEPSDPFVEVAQLHHEWRQRLAYRQRDCVVARFDAVSQLASISRALRRDQSRTGLPLGLDYPMTEQQVRDKLKAFAQYEATFKPGAIAYVIPDIATNTKNNLSLYFEGGHLSEIVSGKSEMDASMQEKDIDLLRKQAADWVARGVEILLEDPQNSNFIYRDQRTDISKMSFKAVDGKFSVSTTASSSLNWHA